MSTTTGFSVAPGALLALTGAGTSTTDESAEQVSLDGDLGQMGTMAHKLREAGLDIRHSDVYPVLQGDEIETGLRLLFERRIDGWWNQKREMVARGICTDEEFTAKLSAQVAAAKKGRS